MDKKSYITEGISDWKEAVNNVVNEIKKYQPNDFPEEIIANLQEHIKMYYSMYPKDAGDKLEKFVDSYIGLIADNKSNEAADLFAKDFMALKGESEDFEWPMVAQASLRSKSYIVKGITSAVEAMQNVVSQIREYRKDFPTDVLHDISRLVEAYYSHFGKSQAGGVLEPFIDEYIDLVSKNTEESDTLANEVLKNASESIQESQQFEREVGEEEAAETEERKQEKEKGKGHTLRWPAEDKQPESLSMEEKEKRVKEMKEEEIVFKSLDDFLKEFRKITDIESALTGMAVRGVITMDQFEEMKSGIAGKPFDDAKEWLIEYINSHKDIASTLSHRGLIQKESRKIDKAAEYDKTGGIWEVNNDEKTIQRRKMIDNAIKHDAALKYGIGDKIIYATLDSFGTGTIEDINDDGKYVVENKDGEKEIVEPEKVCSTVLDEIF